MWWPTSGEKKHDAIWLTFRVDWNEFASLHLVLHSLHHPEALAEVKKAKRENQKEWCRNVGVRSFGRTGSCLHSKPHSLVYRHEGKCPHCWVGRPWLRWSEGPPSGKFGETTGWRSANIAVNSTSLSPWLPAGVYLKIPDVKVTKYFVRLVSAAGLCQYLGILMYSDEMGVNRDCLWRMENSMLSPCCCISVRTFLSCIPIGLLIQQCLTVDFPFFTGNAPILSVWWISAFFIFSGLVLRFRNALFDWLAFFSGYTPWRSFREDLLLVLLCHSHECHLKS